MHRESPKEDQWMLALLALGTVALYLLLHPYFGMVHDARLYTIQALSHLHPELYGNDIFVRYGSQDNYTLFSPLFALTISWLGIEPAAALLTLSAMLLFLLAFWLLARTLVSRWQASIALLLLALIPAYYGPAQIFHYLEEFVTPRQLSEALTLFALVAFFRNRSLLALPFAIAAMSIHPIIGSSGIAMLALYWLLPHWRKLWPVAFGTVALTALALLGWLPISRWQFDAQWYEIVKMRTYLRLLNWDIEDWGRTVTVLATLSVAALSLEDKLRRLSLATLLASSLLLLVAFVGGDLLRIVIVVQAQPWRVMWFATVIAILLMPALYVAGWRGTLLSRCSLLLLTAAWTIPHSVPPLIFAPLAVMASAFRTRPLPANHGRLLQAGAWLGLVIALLHSVATEQLALEDGLTELDSLPPQLDRLLLLSHNGVIPALVLLAIGYGVVRLRSSPLLRALTIGTLAAIAMLAVPIARTWAATRYDSTLKESFAVWRAHIPPGSEVLWIDTAAEMGADSTWLLLERPSYMSMTQAPNALFSRQAAVEMSRRAGAITRVLPFHDPFRPQGSERPKLKGPLLLRPICATLNVRYIVTNETLADATPILPPPDVPILYRSARLYICP